MISVNPKGEFTMKVLIVQMKTLKLNFDEEEERDIVPLQVEDIPGYAKDENDDDDLEEEVGVINKDTLFSLIYPNTFIGLQSPPKSVESFCCEGSQQRGGERSSN